MFAEKKLNKTKLIPCNTTGHFCTSIMAFAKLGFVKEMEQMKKILVIDDDEDIRDIIVFALSSDGFDVASAISGVDALNILNNSNPNEYPDFIIVDNLMPEMDGITFIHEVKEKYPETLGKIPLALSSAMGTVDPSLEKFSELIILHKPMDLNDLLQAAREACQKKS